MRGCSPSVISREMQIVTTVKDHLAPEWPSLQTLNNNRQGGRGGKQPSQPVA